MALLNEDFEMYKEQGNKAFKTGNFAKALENYTQGLKVADDPKEKAILLKNRAAVYLKTSEYNLVAEECSSALQISPNDPKALFRRAQAYEALQNYEKAYSDARSVQSLDPKNKEVQALLSRLHALVQEKLTKSSQLGSKVSRMLEILFDCSKTNENRNAASQNLIVLAKEKSGARLLLENGLLSKMMQMLKIENNAEIRTNCNRVISTLSNDISVVKEIFRECGVMWLLQLMNSEDDKVVSSGQYTFQNIMDCLSGQNTKEGTKPLKKEMEENKKEMDTLFTVLTGQITARTLSTKCRDAVLELLTRNVGYEALDWSKKFIKIGGLLKLLEVSSELQEYHYESCIDITENTRNIVAICLDKIYQGQYDEKERKVYTDIVDEYVKLKLISPEIESKVRVTVTLTTLLMGPLDVGNMFIAREGFLEMLLAMANSEDELQQKVACEALIFAASKKDKCKTIASKGTEILKRLYMSKSEAIKVRALVGLCKLGSLGGSDATMRPFAEGASLKLAEACRRFLVNAQKDKDMRRWACEGLSYLTLDAEVKEKLISDSVALKSMIELAQSGDLNCIFGVVTTFVNLVNAYDKQEILPEMIELAKFAKQHIPEEHELDDKDFVDKRANILAQEGAASALVALSKTESHNSRELIARIFNAMCEQQQNRGLVTQQGGTKALLKLAIEGTKKGKIVASQALARIAITMNPEVAFPGQRAYEVIRPLLQLLDVDCSGLENFEGLMALCNIAGMSESARQRILKEKGLALLEHYMFEPHEMIRRAAFQCMANMCASPDVIKILEGQNDKLKYLFLSAADEDIEIVKAAAGGLCMVLPESEICCNKIFEANDWAEILQYLTSHADLEVHYRGSFLVYTLIATSKDIARKIIDTHTKDALIALANIENPEFVHEKAREFSIKSLKSCDSYELIQWPPRDE